MQASIYQRQCPQIAEVFNAAGRSDKVLVAALDFAKEKHLCLLCKGNGDQLLKPFTVRNDREGLDYLRERIATTCKRHAIGSRHVIVGGEDCPSYALNLLWALHGQGDLCVVRVNAWKAKKQRENVQASTDKLDLLGVAKTLINRDAYPVFDADPELDVESRDYEALRELGRTRDALVTAATRLSNRMHNVGKVLFPGFLDAAEDNPVRAFSKASLELMEGGDFHAAAYARKRPAPLAARLAKLRLREPADKARALIARAGQALPPCPGSVGFRQECLRALTDPYRHLGGLTRALEKRQAEVLARTPAALLTSISGIGIISAAAIGGEQGHADRLGPLRHLCSYAGVVPGTAQTGGADKPGKTTKVKPRCNRRLKRHLVHAVNHMGKLLGPPEFRAAYRQLESRGAHADFVMARRFLRVAKTLMVNRTIYLPGHVRGAGREALFEYLQEHWPKLAAKWRALGALDAAFAPDAPLGFWRTLVGELYGIELSLGRGAEVELLAVGEGATGLLTNT